MATIVQPYNYAREVAAMNLLGGLLTDALQRHHEANKNRKANTAIGTAIQQLGSMGQQNLMDGQVVLQGYNNDNDQWSKAFHQSYTPMTQFNAGTAEITPQAPTLPTGMDAQRTLAQTLANPRFAMVDPAQAQQLFTPYLNSIEQARTEQRRNAAAEAVSKAATPQDRLAAMYQGAITGDISSDILKLAQGNYEFENPNMEPYMHNTGQTSYYGGFNPRTGEFTRQGSYENTTSPDTLAKIAGDRYEVNMDYDIRNRDIATKQYTAMKDFLKQKNEEITRLTEEIDATKDPTAKNALRERINILRNEVQQIEGQMQGLFNPGYSVGYGSNNYSVANLDQYADIVNKYANEYGVDPDLIMAIMQQESGGNIRAVSNKGAQGLMQLMPDTAEYVCVTNPYDPEQNIRGGVKYFAEQLKKFGGDVNKALWAYNAGPGRVISGYMPGQTKNYINNVTGIYNKRKLQRKTQPAASTKTQSKAQTTQIKTTDNSKVIYTHPDGDTITENELAQIYRDGAKKGNTIAGIDSELQKLGYSRGKTEVTPEQNWTPSYMRTNMSSVPPAIDIKNVAVQNTPSANTQAPVISEQPRTQPQELDPLLLPTELQSTPNKERLLSIEASKPKEQLDKYLLPDYSASSMPNDVDPLNVLNGIDTNDMRRSVQTLQNGGIDVNLSDPATLAAIASMSKKENTFTEPIQWSLPVKKATTQEKLGEYSPYYDPYNSWPSNFDSTSILNGMDPQELQQKIKALQASGFNIDLSDPFDPAILSIIASMSNN